MTLTRGKYKHFILAGVMDDVDMKGAGPHCLTPLTACVKDVVRFHHTLQGRGRALP